MLSNSDAKPFETEQDGPGRISEKHGSRDSPGTADTATPTRHFDDCKGKFPDNFEQTQPLSPLSTAHTANVLRLRNSGLLMIPRQA